MMQRLLSLEFVTNPILLREFRARMRTPKTIVLLCLYLAVLGGLTLAFIFVSNIGGVSRPGENRYILLAVAIIQLVLMAFIAPGLTAGAISGERERQTLNILLTTHLSPFKILFSKLVSSMAFLWLVLFSTLPLYAIVLLHGGVSPVKLLYMFGFYLVVMVSFGMIGLFCSTWFKRTGVAVVVSYMITLFLLGGTAIAAEVINVFLSAVTGKYGYRPSLDYITALNPVVNVWQILENNSFLLNRGGGASPLFLPPWLYFTITYLAAAVVLMWLSVRLLTPVKRRQGEKIVQKEAAE